jgi:predicted transcriptional regulator
VKMFISYFHPLYPRLFIDLLSKEIDFTLIFTESVFNRMRTDCSKELELLTGSGSADLYVCDDSIKLTTITVTERFTYLCFFNKEGMYDHRKIMSFDESASKWGEELFTHYQNLSRRITEL